MPEKRNYKSKRVEEQESVTIDRPVMGPVEEVKPKRKWRKWLWVVVIVGAIVVWWTKTKTWPIVAVVSGRPITRFEVDRTLFRQSGAAVIDSLITQRLVEAELTAAKVTVDRDQVTARVDQLKQGLTEGQTLEDELAKRGMSLAEVEKLIELQLKINKVVEPMATVSAEEVAKYVKENGKYLTGKTEAEKKTEAEEILKQDKLQESVNSWIEGVRSRGKVWKWPW